MAEDKRAAIRSALDAIPGAPATMTAEACIETTLMTEGYHLVPGSELPVAAWDPGRPRCCPRCGAVAIAAGRPRAWLVYSCGRCGAPFARHPLLAGLLPLAGACRAELRAAAGHD